MTTLTLAHDDTLTSTERDLHLSRLAQQVADLLAQASAYHQGHRPAWFRSEAPAYGALVALAEQAVRAASPDYTRNAERI